MATTSKIDPKPIQDSTTTVKKIRKKLPTITSLPQDDISVSKPTTRRSKSNAIKPTPLKEPRMQGSQTVKYPWLKNYPENIKWDTEIQAKPLYCLLDEAARLYPHNNCIDFMGKKTTYEELIDLVNRATYGLQKLGVKKGTKVGLFMPNISYFVIFYYAIIKAGGVVVNYNPLYVDPEIRRQVIDSETEIMVTLDLKALYDKLVPILDDTPLKRIIVCPIAKALPFPKNILFPIIKFREKANPIPSHQVFLFSDVVDNNGAYTPVVINPHEDIALLQYTGGTTGVPKGAMLTHANVYINAEQAFLWFSGANLGKEKILAALPFFHVFAMTVVMNLAIRTGSEIVILFPRFSVEEAIKLIAKHKITFFPAVPTIYNMINHYPDVHKFDLTSLRMCLSGGASLPYQVKEDFEKITGCSLAEGYGLSETSPVAVCNSMCGLNKPGSIGIPLPATTVKIVSLENPKDEVALGEKGQIAIKGPQVMKGYWRCEEETKKVFVDDYFLTGDIGYMDADGHTFLVDRIKDIIICSGFNVYPRVVEEAIYLHPAVEEVTVIGVPDEKRGETVKAFVKLRTRKRLSQSALLDFLSTRLSPIEMPKSIEFRKSLPKTMIGKLSKKELVAEERAKKRK
jgi:long-chain acyl-CoA synthetase